MIDETDLVGPFRDRLQLSFENDPVCAVLRPRGAFSPEAGLAWIGIAVADPRYHAGMSILYDLTDLDPRSLTTATIRKYVQRIRDHSAPAAERVRVAFIAPSPVAFGMIRMFEAFASFEVPRDRAVFRTMDEALAWLRNTPDQT
ncbi:MAG: hypothetical protein JJT88_11070 [Gammaproteobacteria bacterium]|nr:hypothetical protein [Gammaproteobacteria bacterium]